jgi:hypothetical protein
MKERQLTPVGAPRRMSWFKVPFRKLPDDIGHVRSLEAVVLKIEAQSRDSNRCQVDRVLTLNFLDLSDLRQVFA